MKKVKNMSNKVVNFGEVLILPSEEKEIPVAYERSPILEVYKRLGLIEVTGSETTKVEEKPAEVDAEKQAEELRQARLASLEGISDEDLCKLAEELEINPAKCKDNADVLKKVKAALKK